jgi:hypothetical protein
MKSKLAKFVLAMILLAALGNTTAAGTQVTQLQLYRDQGIDQTDQARGRQLWYSVVDGRGCTSCHGNNPAATGKHAKTGKTIEPMALSVSPARYQDGKKLEKWFLRNCKWTLGRQCSLQEKADLLTWLANQ